MAEPTLGTTVDRTTNLLRKKLAANKDVVRTVGKNQSLLRWLPQKTDGAGNGWECPAIYAGPAAIAPTRAEAQAIAQTTGGTVKSEVWKGDWYTLKGSLYFQAEAIIKATAGTATERAYYEMVSDTFDMQLTKFGDFTNELAWSGAGKAIAYGSFSAGVITLTDKSLASLVKPGQPLLASANDGTSTGHSTFAGTGYVIASNPNAGTITVSATDGGTAGTPTGWTGNVYLFRYGMFGGGSSPNAMLHGIQQWLPATDPTTSFLNVDRTKDIVSFSGVRLSSSDVTGLGAYQIAQRLAVAFKNKGYDLGGEKAIWVHPEVWLQLAYSAENSGVKIIQGTNMIAGITSYKIATVMGILEVMTDKSCPFNQMYLLDRKSWMFQSIGQYPRDLSFGSTKAGGQVQSNSDDIEYRLIGLGDLICKAPGANAVAWVPGSPTM